MRLPSQMPASSVSKCPGGNNRQERKDAVSGQEDRETTSRLPRGQTGAHEGKTVQTSATCGDKAMVPWEFGAHCSIVCLAKGREGLGEQHLADFAILPNAFSRGCRA